MWCKHCTKRYAVRSRGLCRKCYFDLKIRKRYKIVGFNRGVALDNTERPTPHEPTTASPGTETKVRIMMERASRGESLWHPDDRGM